MPDAWLKGPVPEVPLPLQPVAHALLNVRMELEAAVSGASEEELWRRPAGIAPAGFHVRHLCGSVDRLFTYARGQALSEEQLAVMADEKNVESRPDRASLLALVDDTIARALTQLRGTDSASLDDAREVGRLKLPSTVRGLLFHAAEHGARHAGQTVTTMKFVREIR